MADSIDVILYGFPAPTEVRGRAVYDLKRFGRSITGDVDVEVYRTVYSRRGMQPATACAAHVEQVVLAALQCKTIEARRSIRQITYRRPVVDGLDSMIVSFRPVSDRLLLA